MPWAFERKLIGSALTAGPLFLLKTDMKKIKLIGYIFIILVILAYMPIAVPRLFSLGQYTVVTGSMEPRIPVGSLVYTKSVQANDIAIGDVIVFESYGVTITHRVVGLNEDGAFITKGDANDGADFNPVYPQNVLGRVLAYVPLLGTVAGFLGAFYGKLAAFVVVALGCGLIAMGSRMQPALVTDCASNKSSFDDTAKDGASLKKAGTKPIFILIAGLLVIVIACGDFFTIYRDYSAANDLYDSINDTYVTSDIDTDAWYNMVSVDFNSIWQLNKDVVAYIYVENTDILYPLAQGADDDEYLRTALDGSHATAGTIFLEAANSSDFSDSHSVVFGHNMRNLSMFGTLKYYKTEEVYLKDGHEYFQIITSKAKYRYQIFSYFDTEGGSWVYSVPYSDTEEFSDYIAKLKSSSYQDIEMSSEVSSSDHIVTLSTCSSGDKRFTIHGVRVEEH